VQLVDRAVNRSPRARRTEERIVAAASELFVARGWRGTTLSDVATAAGVADRTIYVRFATKAELLKRVLDVAVLGDTAPVALRQREWVVRSMTAPTLEERVDAVSAGSARLMERIAPVLAVAVEAASAEPVIAEASQAARESTYRHHRDFWQRLRGDGLMHPDSDVGWVIDTSALLGNADTYLHMTRTIRWTRAEYERWRRRTWMHLATTPGPGPG